MRLMPLLLSSFLLLTAWGPLRSADPSKLPQPAKAAVLKALDLIQKSATTYREKRTCFSCHHQTLPILAVSAAKDHGYKIDEENYKEQLKRTIEHLKKNRERYWKGKGQGGGVDTASWALWALDAGSWESEETTAAVVEYLLLRDAKRDHWRGTTSRPPTQASNVTRTAIIMEAIETYGSKKQKERIAARRKKVHQWLQKAKPKDTEEKVFQLRGLAYLGEKPEKLKPLVESLIRDQREDGGWGQKAEMKSDAYATGSALVALHLAGEMAATHPAYQRGVAFLLKTQKSDGSWHVKTRSRPIQTYFESGFPHRKDQFISVNASSWAAMALMYAAGPQKDKPSVVGDATNEE